MGTEMNTPAPSAKGDPGYVPPDSLSSPPGSYLRCEVRLQNWENQRLFSLPVRNPLKKPISKTSRMLKKLTIYTFLQRPKISSTFFWIKNSLLVLLNLSAQAVAGCWGSG